MPRTTYCMPHEALEIVGDVTKVRTFMVMEHAGEDVWPERTGRSATEVWGVTDAGCKVHFIGGPRWNR